MGYGERIIQNAIRDNDEKCRSVYAVIKNDNGASIHMIQKCGFCFYGYGKKEGRRILVDIEPQSLLIFRFVKS